MKTSSWLLLTGLVLMLAGCSSKTDNVPAPAAHNAFTEKIESGKESMDKIRDQAAAENARIQAQADQADSVESQH
jgi:PBP1b-binding outer membrane lipoprotein LpoB